MLLIYTRQLPHLQFQTSKIYQIYSDLTTNSSGLDPPAPHNWMKTTMNAILFFCKFTDDSNSSCNKLVIFKRIQFLVVIIKFGKLVSSSIPYFFPLLIFFVENLYLKSSTQKYRYCIITCIY